jgi:DNA polymerase III alpha subunit (gram-positive type)
MKFDKKIIASEFFRNNINTSLLNRTNICTMERSTNFCALPGYKWPKLSELYKKLFNEEFQEQHNAKHDIYTTHKCFWVDMGWVNGWCVKYGKYHKALNEHTVAELSVLIVQMEGVYRSYLKGI